MELLSRHWFEWARRIVLSSRRSHSCVWSPDLQSRAFTLPSSRAVTQPPPLARFLIQVFWAANAFDVDSPSRTAEAVSVTDAVCNARLNVWFTHAPFVVRIDSRDGIFGRRDEGNALQVGAGPVMPATGTGRAASQNYACFRATWVPSQTAEASAAVPRTGSAAVRPVGGAVLTSWRLSGPASQWCGSPRESAVSAGFAVGAARRRASGTAAAPREQ